MSLSAATIVDLKNKPLVVALVAVVAGIEMGCANAETIRIGGSCAVIGAVASIAEAFGRDRAPVNIVKTPCLDATGSVRAVRERLIDIAVIRRMLTDAERAEGVKSVLLAQTPVVFVATPERVPPQLSQAQLVAVYEGRSDRWSDGTPLRVILRPAVHSDAQALRKPLAALQQAHDKALARPGVAIAATDMDNTELLGNVDGAFGTMPLMQLREQKQHLSAIPIDGVMPTPEAIASGSYPFVTPLYLATAPGASAAVLGFIDYARSPAANAQLLALGCLPAAIDAQ